MGGVHCENNHYLKTRGFLKHVNKHVVTMAMGM